jgi:hypothetical protein
MAEVPIGIRGLQKRYGDRGVDVQALVGVDLALRVLWAIVAVASLLSLLLFAVVLLPGRLFVTRGHHGLDG